ncbi:MAG TPA: glycoside hydrolase family 76 protein [Verrucomicrobiae bacterium]|jgi:hypothetical protein
MKSPAVFVVILSLFCLPTLRAGQDGKINATNAEFRAQFIQLCDLATVKLNDGKNKNHFFVESYAVRALCAAYDLTGNTNYLNTCCRWSERMVDYQERMTPHGAYYMQYNRKPGETTNDWYVADSASIGMAVLATAVRCPAPERSWFLQSAKNFADLTIKNYVRPSGGVSDGLWHQSNDEWWCSSAIFGSFLFNLYANTKDSIYLKTAFSVTDWLNQLDLTKDQPFPLSQQGPAMIFYVMENYSAGWPYLSKDEAKAKAAQAKIDWCFNWITAQQQTPLASRAWSPAKSWGLKFGGLPFHEYVFARYLPGDDRLATLGDEELPRLVPSLPARNQELTQLSVFMMMSYAERLNPGGVYRNRY